MARIHVLSEDTANRIAAGEVVERPASVVKELVENALDAGATRVLVELEEGGRKLVRVTDDGCGMSDEDAALAVQRFATSKIADERDLHQLATLGFRGEALPSIAAVSRFTLTTREAAADAATLVRLEGGEMVEYRPAAGPPGTTVEVGSLFYNTPVRLKFLASANTERGHAADWVQRLALGHPQVAFVLKHNGAPIFSTPGRGELLDVLGELYGRATLRHFLPVRYESAGLLISGYTASPELTRVNRSYQHFLVNSRFVRSRLLSNAVTEAYGPMLRTGKQAVCALRVDIQPELVDANVHPTKIEVRFTRSWEIHNLVKTAVTEAFAGRAGMPAEAPSADGGAWGEVAQDRVAGRPYGPFQPGPPGPPRLVGPADRPAAVSPFADRVDERDEGLEVHGTPPARVPRGPGAVPLRLDFAAGLSEARVLGQIGCTYLAAESPAGLLLVDQHRASERVIEQRLRTKDRSGRPAAQLLVIPITLELTPRESAALDEAGEALAEVGFVVERFGGNTWLVRGVPAVLGAAAGEQDLMALVGELTAQEFTGGRGADAPDWREALRASVACQAAIKAGVRLPPAEMERLLADLAATDRPEVCPHGQPIVLTIARRAIDHRFERE